MSATDLAAWLDRLEGPGNETALVQACERFVRRLTAGTDLAAAVAAMPPELREDPAFAALWSRFAADYQAKLSPEASVPLARAMLRQAAADPALAPALAAFAETHEDEDQLALEILAAGVAISMVILTATTSFRGRLGKMQVEKSAASADQISAAAGWVGQLRTGRGAEAGGG